MKNLTKKSLALILVLLMLSSVLGICAENKPDKVYKLRLAHIYTDDHPYTIECRNIAEKIKQKTNNAVEITVYPAAQLGGEPDITNNVMIGAIDMAVVGIGELAKRANDLNIFEAPYIFETYEDGVKRLKILILLLTLMSSKKLWHESANKLLLWRTTSNVKFPSKFT